MKRLITPQYIRKSLDKEKGSHKKSLLALRLSIAHWEENLKAVQRGESITKYRRADYCACCHRARNRDFLYGGACFSPLFSFATCPLISRNGSCCNGKWGNTNGSRFGQYTKDEQRRLERACKDLIQFIEKRYKWYLAKVKKDKGKND